MPVTFELNDKTNYSFLPKMPPKKPHAEDMEEIKQSLNFMSEELTKVAKQQSRLHGLMEEVCELKKLIMEKDNKICLLERCVDELKQYTRMEDVIVSGLNIRHRSYARATAGAGDGDGEDDTPGEMFSLEQQVLHFFASKDIKIESDAIAACLALPKKDNKTKPAIIIRFVNRKDKSELLRQGKKLRGTDVYINEHLTKRNADIARRARMLRKQNKIQATWTRNCKVWIKLNGTPEEAKVILIFRTWKDLSDT